MLQEERLENIFGYIKRKKFVTVEELAQKMVVSPMTIRRDLNRAVSRRCAVTAESYFRNGFQYQTGTEPGGKTGDRKKSVGLYQRAGYDLSGQRDNDL